MNDVLEQLANDPWFRWQHAFLAEWCSLAQGNADPHQVLDLAGEVYSRNPSRDPVEVAREAWDEESNSSWSARRMRSVSSSTPARGCAAASQASMQPRNRGRSGPPALRPAS